MRLNVRYICSLFILGLLAQTAQGQLVDIESHRLANDTSRFGGVVNVDFSYSQTNTTTLLKFGNVVMLQARSQSKKDVFMLFGNYDLVKTNLESIANAGAVHFRYVRGFNKTFRLELFTQYQSNAKLLLKHRVLAGAGTRINLFRIKKNYSALGVAYMAEWEELLLSRVAPHFDHRLSSYFVISTTFAEDRITFESITYYQPNLLLFKDFRILNNTSFSIEILKWMAVDLSVKYNYDAYPPVKIAKNSFSTEVGLEFTF